MVLLLLVSGNVEVLPRRVGLPVSPGIGRVIGNSRLPDTEQHLLPSRRPAHDSDRDKTHFQAVHEGPFHSRLTGSFRRCSAWKWCHRRCRTRSGRHRPSRIALPIGLDDGSQAEHLLGHLQVARLGQLGLEVLQRLDERFPERFVDFAALGGPRRSQLHQRCGRIGGKVRKTRRFSRQRREIAAWCRQGLPERLDLLLLALEGG